MFKKNQKRPPKFNRNDATDSEPTCELVKRLEGREGVKTIKAEPYQDVQIKVNGPAVILIVTD